jgi:hypothetical protein
MGRAIPPGERDITEGFQELVNHSFQAVEALVAAETSPVGLVLITSSGRILYGNPAFRSLFGSDLQDLAVPGFDAAQLATLVRTGEPQQFEFRTSDSGSGTRWWCHVRRQAGVGERSQRLVLTFTGIGDGSARKGVRPQLELLEALAERCGRPAFALDARARLRWYNRRFAELMHALWLEPPALGWQLAQIIRSPAQEGRVLRGIRRSLAGGCASASWRVPGREGVATRAFRFLLSPIGRQGGAITGTLAYVERRPATVAISRRGR